MRTIVGNYLSPWKVEGGQQMFFEMAAWGGVHASAWPVGIYHKAHFHGPGAVLLGMSSEGYVLLWPRQYGTRPFQDGHGDEVVKVPWKKNSIYSQQSEWFHQHFNTGKSEARHIGEYGGASMGLPRRAERGRPGAERRMEA